MKVKELIERLQALGEKYQDWDVELIGNDGFSKEAEEVEIDFGQSRLSQRVLIG